MPLPRLFFAFLGARFLGLIGHLPRFQHKLILMHFEEHKHFALTPQGSGSRIQFPREFYKRVLLFCVSARLTERQETGRRKTRGYKLQRAYTAGKVYFVAWYYDVKLQADNHVRWDVAERLNRKQVKH